MNQIDAIVADDFTVIKRGGVCHVVGNVEFSIYNVTLQDAAALAANLAAIAKNDYLNFDKIDVNIWSLKNALFPFEIIRVDWEEYLISYCLLGTGYSIRLRSPDDFILAIGRAHYCSILKEIAGA